MTEATIGALIGVSGTAVLALAAGSIRGLFSAGGHKERLDKHEVRLDKHQEAIDEMPVKYVPRTEIASELSAIRESNKRTERWVEFLVKKEAVQPQDS